MLSSKFDGGGASDGVDRSGTVGVDDCIRMAVVIISALLSAEDRDKIELSFSGVGLIFRRILLTLLPRINI